MIKSNSLIPGEYRTSRIQAGLILAICTMLYMVNYMDRQIMAVVLEPMKIDLGLSDTQAGMIQTIFFLSMALFALPASFLVDRWSRRKSLGVMALTWSAATYMTGLGHGFWSLMAPRTVVGVGESGFASAGTALITAAFSERSRSKVMGVFNMAIPLGAALGMMLGGYISVKTGNWRSPFFIFAVPGIVLGLISFFLKDYKTEIPTDASGRRTGFFKTVLVLWRTRTLRWQYIGMAMQNIMIYSFLAWGPAWVMRVQDVDEKHAGTMVGALALLAVAGAPIGGVLADRWQRKNNRARIFFPAITFPLAAIFFIICLRLDLRGPGLAAGVIFGLLLNMGSPALSAVSQDVVRPSQKGLSWGMAILCQYALGGGWAPFAVGLVSDGWGGGAMGLRNALCVTALGGLAASICYLMGARHYLSDRAKVREAVLMAG
jgi:MFS family permease